MVYNILCVDDEPDILDTLERLLRKKFNVLKADSGLKGLEILKKEKISVIISDQRMPEMTGVEFLKESQNLQPESIRILLTGYTDISSVVGAINSGQVYRYITKPWDSVDLENTVSKAVQTYEISQQLRQKNIELKKAYNELKTLDQAKSQFMILINHELKTPITVMTSFLELLKETPLSSEQSSYLKKIEKSNLRLTNLVEDVLDIISAEAGVFEVFKEKVVSQEILLPSYKEFLSHKLKSQNLKIEANVQNFSFHADMSVIRKILYRLIDNAIKFGKNDSTISVSISKEGVKKTRFSVSNKGKPLSEEVTEKILKPFALNENIMNHSQGAGLGLAYCQTLLKTHDSQLEFQSEKEQVTVSFLV